MHQVVDFDGDGDGDGRWPRAPLRLVDHGWSRRRSADGDAV